MAAIVGKSHLPPVFSSSGGRLDIDGQFRITKGGIAFFQETTHRKSRKLNWNGWVVFNSSSSGGRSSSSSSGGGGNGHDSHLLEKATYRPLSHDGRL